MAARRRGVSEDDAKREDLRLAEDLLRRLEDMLDHEAGQMSLEDI